MNKSYLILSLHNSSYQVALVKATQKDHAPSGQVHTKIVMDLDTNPTRTTLMSSSFSPFP